MYAVDVMRRVSSPRLCGHDGERPVDAPTPALLSWARGAHELAIRRLPSSSKRMSEKRSDGTVAVADDGNVGDHR
jgi:hypothetical protein